MIEQTLAWFGLTVLIVSTSWMMAQTFKWVRGINRRLHDVELECKYQSERLNETQTRLLNYIDEKVKTR